MRLFKKSNRGSCGSGDCGKRHKLWSFVEKGGEGGFNHLIRGKSGIIL